MARAEQFGILQSGVNIIFMTHTDPHFTTIADFISWSSEAIIELFRNVLFICKKMDCAETRRRHRLALSGALN